MWEIDGRCEGIVRVCIRTEYKVAVDPGGRLEAEGVFAVSGQVKRVKRVKQHHTSCGSPPDPKAPSLGDVGQ